MNAAITQSTVIADKTIQFYPLRNGKVFQIEFERMPSSHTDQPYISFQLEATREQVELFHKHLTQILDQTKPFNP